jgi:hypothetical protein
MDYLKIKQMFESRFPSSSAAARAVGMTPQGYADMIQKHTMKLETFELILRIINAPASDFFEAPIPPTHTTCTNPQCQFEKDELMTALKEVKALNAQLTEALLNMSRRGEIDQGEITGGMETPRKTG